jgi:hypothetical protein
VTEWYEDPKLAIEQFRDRLNNEHADGLCETLLSIFQFEHDEFYNHLQARMEDLKFVQRQLQEARREKRSYVLFVLAGIPLLHSFQILIFPWLSQGTGLFQQLN